jgi:hypothetical protein
VRVLGFLKGDEMRVARGENIPDEKGISHNR